MGWIWADGLVLYSKSSANVCGGAGEATFRHRTAPGGGLSKSQLTHQFLFTPQLLPSSPALTATASLRLPGTHRHKEVVGALPSGFIDLAPHLWPWLAFPASRTWITFRVRGCRLSPRITCCADTGESRRNQANGCNQRWLLLNMLKALGRHSLD